MFSGLPGGQAAIFVAKHTTKGLVDLFSDIVYEGS